MRTKTLSDYPLLIGEILRRSEARRLRTHQEVIFFRLPSIVLIGSGLWARAAWR